MRWWWHIYVSSPDIINVYLGRRATQRWRIPTFTRSKPASSTKSLPPGTRRRSGSCLGTIFLDSCHSPSGVSTFCSYTVSYSTGKFKLKLLIKKKFEKGELFLKKTITENFSLTHCVHFLRRTSLSICLETRIRWRQKLYQKNWDSLFLQITGERMAELREQIGRRKTSQVNENTKFKLWSKAFCVPLSCLLILQ